MSITDGSSRKEFDTTSILPTTLNANNLDLKHDTTTIQDESTAAYVYTTHLTDLLVNSDPRFTCQEAI